MAGKKKVTKKKVAKKKAIKYANRQAARNAALASGSKK